MRPFSGATLRLAEVKYPVAPVEGKPARRGLPGRTLEGLALVPSDAFELLLAWDESLCRKQEIEPGGELRYWATAARFALELMGTGAITPGAVPPRPVGSRRRGGEQAATVCWSPAFRKQEDREIFLQLAASMPVLALGTHIAEAGDLSSREEAGAYVLYSFLQAVMTAEIKKVIASIEGELTPYKANYRRGYSPLTELWWKIGRAHV